MTVGEIVTLLEKMPPDEEVFIRSVDDDDNPFFMLVDGVTIDPEGIMIQGGPEFEFE